MTKPVERDLIYRGRRFQTETIELCVRWYITYRLSYRDLAAMMAERGIIVSHTTIMRWVLRYVPEYEERWDRFARSVNSGTATLRNARKVFYNGGLYLLVMPNGGRYWRYNYRFCGKYNTLALGIRPDVSLQEARSRHQVARSMLANGIDPSTHKRALGKYAFVTPPREACVER
jgi:hypothetical protein